MNNYIVPVISILIGIVFWIAITTLTGQAEAWDDPVYFWIGLPFLWVVNIVLSAFGRKRPWRWGLLTTYAQVFPMFFTSEDTNLWPLSLVLLTMLAIPMIIANYIGVFIGNKFIEHAVNSK